MSAFTCRNSRRRAGPALVPVLGLALAAGLSGCGGGGNSGGSPVVPDPPQPVTTTLPTATFVGIQAGEGRFTDVTITVTGTLTATLDWTFSVNDLDIYVTNTSCAVVTTAGLQSLCTAIGRTTSPTAKPERLTVNVTPGNYRIWAANFGPNAESGTLSLSATGTR